MAEVLGYRFLELVLKTILRDHHLLGFEKRLDRPSVFVCNHLGSYGPVAVMLFFPVKAYPWIAHELVEKGACADYLEREFVEKELRLGRPLGRWLAKAIEPICVSLMRHLEAISVPNGGRLALQTIQRSAEYIAAGRNILVFPENEAKPLNGVICKFDSGFVEIAENVHDRTGDRLDFYPIGVNKRERTLSLGEPVSYVPENPPAVEKRRIIAELELRVTALCGGPSAI